MNKQKQFWLPLILAWVVCMRGIVYARLLDGSYPVASFVIDFLGFSLLVLLMMLLSRAIRWGCRNINGRICRFTSSASFPLLLVTVQLHSPHVAACE